VVVSVVDGGILAWKLMTLSLLLLLLLLLQEDRWTCSST